MNNQDSFSKANLNINSSNGHNNINIQPEQDINILDYVRIFLKYKLVIIVSLVVVLFITYYHTKNTTRIFQGNARILFESSRPQDMFLPGYATTDSKINNTIELIKSRPVREIALNLIKNDPNYNNLPLSESENPVGYLGNIQTERRRDTDILTVSFESPKPLEASLVPNYIVEALIEQITQHERVELSNIVNFLEEQVEIVANRLRISEEDLRNYKIDRGIHLLSEETKSLINRASDVEAAYEEAVNQKVVLEQQIDYLQNELNRQDSRLHDINSIISSSYMQEIRSGVVALQTRLTNLLTRHEYPLDHPEIVQLNRQLDSAKNNLNNEIQSLLEVRAGPIDPMQYRGNITEKIATTLIELNIADSRANALASSIEDYSVQLSVLPDRELELARLERNYRLNEKIHTMLVEKFEDAKISMQAKIANVRILEEARKPSSPIKPNVRMNYLVGLVIALGIGIATSLILNSLDTKIHTLEDMEKIVNVPIIGTIPKIYISESEQVHLAEQLKKSSGQDRADLMQTQAFIEARLISHYQPKSPVSESYRTLRTNIIARRKKQGPLTIGVTSSAPQEGKSTTVANLGIIFAHTSAKVVIVDLDLRRPQQSVFFNLKKENGVSDYLLDPEVRIDDIIKQSNIPSLDIITSGYIPPNPSEIISSDKMDQLIDKLKERYDYIFIDSPPVIAVTDPLILAKKADMMLLVVAIDKTQKDIVKRSQEIVENIGSSFDGAIANGIVAHKYYSGYSYYYYYFSNYYYYQDGKGKNNVRKSLLGKFQRKN